MTVRVVVAMLVVVLIAVIGRVVRVLLVLGNLPSRVLLSTAPKHTTKQKHEERKGRWRCESDS